MRCERCQGTGRVVRSSPYIAPDLYSHSYVPCPDCLGGIAHCCEGDRACQDHFGDANKKVDDAR